MILKSFSSDFLVIITVLSSTAIYIDRDLHIFEDKYQISVMFHECREFDKCVINN